MRIGDIVVLVHDSKDNGVPEFERFIGAVGEVMYVGAYTRVKFGNFVEWYHKRENLFKLGTTKEEE